ncbi:MAG: NADH-quinone oxidoreductase subunit NuoE [Deltaproteobacteria bacterium]|nr:NADH-quinone oxidoreductase subunit NuoE [Deltaproteobacteria bacterium]
MTTEAKVTAILARYTDAKRDALIPILQEVQEACGYLSKEAVIQIGAYLNLPTSKIYGVATFYNQFRFQPVGDYHIQVCRGTACHVKGSSSVFDRFSRDLGISDGETSKDGKFSLEVVSCIGACGLAPVIAVNGEFHAKLVDDDATRIVKTYKKEAAKKGEQK